MQINHFTKALGKICLCILPSLLYFLIFPAHVLAQELTPDIRLNQLGFYPNAPKVAVIINDSISNVFYITSTNLRDTVFTGKLTGENRSKYSSLKTRIADFTQLTTMGTFVVCIPKFGHSYVFDINNDVNKVAAVSALKGYFYQRASISLEEKFAGKWRRSAGHPDTVVYIHPSAASNERPAGSKISTPGGWYDAGDYNKYIVNSGISMGTLFSAYEDFPDYFRQLNTNIPESGNGIPDILNEAIYNLRWMLTMQDPNDGGVYNKCTNTAFDEFVMPGVTKTERFVVQKTTAATLDFAAVTAQASRILTRYNANLPGLADSCLSASAKAWTWAVKNPDLAYNQSLNNSKYKPAITTGAYGDRKFHDEWFWAASELYITTRNKRFYDTLINHIKDTVVLPTWADVGMLGYYSLLRFNKQLPGLGKSNIEWMQGKVINLADEYISKVQGNAFKTVMGQSAKDFIWGSNAVAANQGILLINAYKILSDKNYMDHALSNLDYLLGRNATGYCFVTGIGSKSPMFPHHRQSGADGITDPVPGLLVGGPNPGRQDGCEYQFNEPETAYADIVCAYASNEIAINWNAPFVYLSNAMEALEQRLGYSSNK